MKFDQIIKTILSHLPSWILCAFFVPNAWSKIVQADQQVKVITNPTVIMIVGLVLLIAVGLFLVNKTMIYGAAILSIYMSFVVFVHMYKGKAYEVTSLIVVGTIFAVFLRNPALFYTQEK